MGTLRVKVNGRWEDVLQGASSSSGDAEVYVGITPPTGAEVLWVDTATNPPQLRAKVTGTWVAVAGYGA